MQLACFINGILTFPGAAHNWTGRAVTWSHINSNARAEKVEYLCGPIGRAFGQTGRAEKLRRTLSFYDGWDISLTGHSNGAAVSLAALALGCPRIERLNLVCGACEADFYRNGLNGLLSAGRIGKVTVYVSECDLALRIAHTHLAHLLGYGVLGLHGPLNISPDLRDRVQTVLWPGYGHSDCWREENFERTMQQLN